MGFLLGLLGKFRDISHTFLGKIAEKFRDPDTGKMTLFGISPNRWPKILLYSFIIIMAIVLLNRLVNSDSFIGSGKEIFEKENKPVTGIQSIDLTQRTEGERDPGYEFQRELENMDFFRDMPNETDYFSGGSFGSTPLSASDCNDVMNKLRRGEVLSSTEKSLADRCITENPMGLSADDLKIAQALMRDDLSQAERELLSRVLSGTATPEERRVALALASDDPVLREQARQAILLGEDGINALGRSLLGDPLTDEERTLLAQIRENAQRAIESGSSGSAGTFVTQETIGTVPESLTDEKIDRLFPEVASALKASVAPLTLSADKEEAIRELSRDVAERAQLIENLEAKLAQEQIRVAPIAEKLARGETLTAEEAQALQDFTERKKALDDLKAIQEERKKELASRLSNLQRSMAEALMTVQKFLPSGAYLEYEGSSVECKDVSVLVKKKKPIANFKKKRSTKVVDLSGKPLTADEIEFLAIERRKKIEAAQAEKDASTRAGTVLGTRASSNSEAQGMTQISDLFIFRDGALSKFELTPDMMIPAVLDSEILISDKGAGQMVRFRIIADVRDPKNNRVIIPKNSIAYGQANGFDPETAMLNMTLSRVVIGSGKTETISLIVGSADGAMGLKGKVYDTTGQFLLGTFVTAFTAGAIGAFSQQYISPFQQATNFGSNAAGSSLAGAAEVATKISELYASKLQNAARIYWVPKGIPVVLIPSGQ